MAQHLAIIGASYLQLPLIEKAKELGYVTHVFAWEAGDVGETSADFFYPISIVEKEQILEKCKEIGISGICSIASDLAMLTVNYVAENMHLTSNSMHCTYLSTNKHAMRLAFETAGDPSPKSIEIDCNTNLNSLTLDYPVIVKPTDRSGSRGIFKLESEKDLSLAVKEALNQSFEKKALIEEYVDGDEYSVESISYNGEHTVLAITKKYTTGVPHFIETAHSQPADLCKEIVEKVKKTVIHALETLEITNGASHSEIKIDSDGNIKIIEIGGRMGGDCIGSHLVKYSTGIDYVGAVIDVAVGKAPNLKSESVVGPVMVKFIFTKEDVEELEKIKDTNLYIETVSYTPENIGKTTDSSNRAGCYIRKI